MRLIIVSVFLLLITAPVAGQRYYRYLETYFFHPRIPGWQKGRPAQSSFSRLSLCQGYAIHI